MRALAGLAEAAAARLRPRLRRRPTAGPAARTVRCREKARARSRSRIPVRDRAAVTSAPAPAPRTAIYSTHPRGRARPDAARRGATPRGALPVAAVAILIRRADTPRRSHRRPIDRDDSASDRRNAPRELRADDVSIPAKTNPAVSLGLGILRAFVQRYSTFPAYFPTRP